MQNQDVYSGYGNKVLYHMCSERPLHVDIDTIKSKLWIIGRAYSAAIERKAGKSFKIDNAAEIIRESNIDTHIKNLNKIKRVDQSNVNILLDAHKYFTDLLKEATGIDKRSLASKYLHFHSPYSVFIFDSIANNKIRKILKPKKLRFSLSRNFDDTYEAFTYRCIYYRDNILEKNIGGFATPRRIDMELLGY